MEKYDLVEPEPANPAAHVSQYDFGISNPIALLVSISRLYLYPYVFAAEEIINHMIDQSEISY